MLDDRQLDLHTSLKVTHNIISLTSYCVHDDLQNCARVGATGETGMI